MEPAFSLFAKKCNLSEFWCDQYNGYLQQYRSNRMPRNALEMFAMVFHGFLRFERFERCDSKPLLATPPVWHCPSSSSPSQLIKLQYSPSPSSSLLLHSNLQLQLSLKMIAMSSRQFVVSITTLITHPITHLPASHNWKIVFQTAVALDDPQHKWNALALEIPHLSQSFAQLIGDLYEIWVLRFWNAFTAHLRDIQLLREEESQILSAFNRHLRSKLLPPPDQRHLSVIQLRHTYFAFLCHLILHHLRWRELQLRSRESESNDDDDDNGDEDDNETDEQKEEEEQNASSAVDNDNHNQHFPAVDLSADMGLIVARIIRCVRDNRPLDIRYKQVLHQQRGYQQTNQICIRYVPMGECVLMVAIDKNLLCANIKLPRVTLPVSRYIGDLDGDRGSDDQLNNNSNIICNLSGKHSLIRILCEDLMHRAIDPFAFNFHFRHNQLTLFWISRLPFKSALCLIFAYLTFRDLIAFGYTARYAYQVSCSRDLWRVIYYNHNKNINGQPQKETDSDRNANWKNLFIQKWLMK